MLIWPPFAGAEGKTYCHEQPALKMASFALQAEKGDMPSKRQPYFRMEDYVPLKVYSKQTTDLFTHTHTHTHTHTLGFCTIITVLHFLKLFFPQKVFRCVTMYALHTTIVSYFKLMCLYYV